MNFVGIGFHEQAITICVVDQSRTVQLRKRLLCLMTAILKSGEPYCAVHPSRRSGSASGGRPASFFEQGD